jgi:hypothetical protein
MGREDTSARGVRVTSVVVPLMRLQTCVGTVCVGGTALMCPGRDVYVLGEHLRTTGPGPQTTLHLTHVRHSRLYNLVVWTIKNFE